MLIGLLRKYKKPMVKDAVSAMFAKEFCCDLIFFTPDQIDFDNQLIKGFSLRYGKWEENISYFPDVVYNDVPSIKDESIYKRLEEEGIPFTTHRIGLNKLELQQRMSNDEYLSKFLIESIPYTGGEEFLSFLIKHKAIFLKPNRGHKGLGIYFFEYMEDIISYQDFNGIKTVITPAELKEHISLLPDLMHYHIQPKISSTTRSGDPYIIRSYVGRNGEGNWINFFNYAAMSLCGNNIVNVSRGSSFSYIEPFLKDTFGDQDKSILRKLNSTSIKIAERVQTLVKPKIDAFGIDLAITNNGSIYIFEVNTMPGSRPFDALVEKHAIPYSIYLANEHKSRC